MYWLFRFSIKIFDKFNMQQTRFQGDGVRKFNERNVVLHGSRSHFVIWMEDDVGRIDVHYNARGRVFCLWHRPAVSRRRQHHRLWKRPVFILHLNSRPILVYCTPVDASSGSYHPVVVDQRSVAVNFLRCEHNADVVGKLRDAGHRRAAHDSRLDCICQFLRR